MALTLQYPDAFVGGVIAGRRLEANGTPAAVMFGVLENALDFVLDDTFPPVPRQRAGEYMLGFAAGWESEP